MAEIIVLGAGMVGVGTALALQERGHQVTLLDRRGPGEETSYGNAGLIQAEAVEPYPLPLDFKTLWAIATGRSNSVAYSFAGLIAQGRALWRYALASRQSDVASRVVPNWAPLALRSTADHAPLIAASGSETLIRREGYRIGYQDAARFDEVVRGGERLMREFGVPSVILDGAALAKAEPGLKQRMVGAIHYTSAWSCQDPGALVKAYAALFERRGGRLARGDAMTLGHSGAGWQVRTEAGAISGEAAVIALGPWSGVLLRRFGQTVPMVLKRGYHRHFEVQNGPTIPFMDANSSTFLSPMRAGLRVLTGADLAPLGAKPNHRQITYSEAAVRQLFDLGRPIEDQPWSGVRPCMPDMLPRMGEVAGQKGLWTNFGHGHQGFTLGPTAGILLAEAFERAAR